MKINIKDSIKGITKERLDPNERDGNISMENVILNHIDLENFADYSKMDNIHQQILYELGTQLQSLWQYAREKNEKDERIVPEILQDAKDQIESISECKARLAEVIDDITQFTLQIVDFMETVELAQEAGEFPVTHNGQADGDCIVLDYQMCNEELVKILGKAQEIFQKYN